MLNFECINIGFESFIRHVMRDVELAVEFMSAEFRE